MPSPTPAPEIVVARYLGLGGAHVAVAFDARWHRATCEACGVLTAGWDYDETPRAAAQEHAGKCRQIPERLWPKDGA